MSKTRSRWRAEVNNDALFKFAGLKCRGRSNDTPVLDLVCDGKLAAQVGLNVFHKRADKSYFRELASGFGSTGDMFFRYTCKHILFGSVLWIMANDPSVSSFNFTRLNRYRIHVSDPFIQRELDAEAATHNEMRVYALLDRSDGRATPEMAQLIAHDRENYFIALAMIQGEDKRRNFHEGLARLVKEQEEKKKLAKDARVKFREMKDLALKVKSMGINSTSLDREIDKLAQSYRGYGTLTSADVKELYGKVYTEEGREKLKREFAQPFIRCFSRVVRMPTSLHDKTNAGYSADIVSYLVSEPFSDFQWFDGTYVQGFDKRRAMLNGSMKK